jgi:hypothetical protein
MDSISVLWRPWGGICSHSPLNLVLLVNNISMQGNDSGTAKCNTQETGLCSLLLTHD